MAASEVDLPEPVPPTTITSPRLVITTSLRMTGSCISSSVGILALMVRTTQPTSPCCTKALTRKRPIPMGEIAKLHSLLESNSRVCLSFMMERTSTALCSGVSTRSDCGRISPSTLMAGGKPDVMNRSEPLRSTRRLSRSCINLIACSRSIVVSASHRPCQRSINRLFEQTRTGRDSRRARGCCRHALLGEYRDLPLAGTCKSCLLERILVLSPEAVFFLGDDPFLQQLGEALIESLHAVFLAGLDGRVHLRDLAFADQIA